MVGPNDGENEDEHLQDASNYIAVECLSNGLLKRIKCFWKTHNSVIFQTNLICAHQSLHKSAVLKNEL
jgi:hypothetical protein